MFRNFFRMEALLFTYVIDMEYIYRIVVLNVEGNCKAHPKHKIKCSLLSNRTPPTTKEAVILSHWI